MGDFISNLNQFVANLDTMSTSDFVGGCCMMGCTALIAVTMEVMCYHWIATAFFDRRWKKKKTVLRNANADLTDVQLAQEERKAWRKGHPLLPFSSGAAESVAAFCVLCGLTVAGIFVLCLCALKYLPWSH